MRKFAIDFFGWTIIEAETKEEAIEQFYDAMSGYNELKLDTIEDITEEE